VTLVKLYRPRRLRASPHLLGHLGHRTLIRFPQDPEDLLIAKTARLHHSSDVEELLSLDSFGPKNPGQVTGTLQLRYKLNRDVLK